MKQDIDSLINSFDPTEKHQPMAEERRSVTFWLPDSYKKKYDFIQERTRRRFGKLLSQVMRQTIDKIHDELES